MFKEKSEIRCFKCNATLEYNATSSVGRQDECPSCYQYIHCCKMCHFYNATAYNDCKEPMANRVIDKEKSNFCDFFKLGTGPNAQSKQDELLDAANSLFKN